MASKPSRNRSNNEDMDGVLMVAYLQGFQERTLDKVDRLLGLLAELGRHPMLKDKLCMHGGTAINLFMLEAPRLSVDIDLSYIGAAARRVYLRGLLSVLSETGLGWHAS